MFDPYHKWLGISKKYRPPTYYHLLGLESGEDDSEVIEEAAIRQSAHLRTYQSGPNGELCTRLLNEISAARTTLLNPAKRKKYDEELARKTPKKAAVAASAPDKDPALAFADLNVSPTLVETPRPTATAQALDRVQRIRRQPGLFSDDKGKYIALAIGGGVAFLLVVVAVIAIALNSGQPEPEQPPLVADNLRQNVKPPIKNRPVNKPPINKPPINVNPKKPDPLPAVPPNRNGQAPKEIHSLKLKGSGLIGDFCVLPGGREVIVTGFRLEKYDLATNRLLHVYHKCQGGSPAHNFLQLSPDGKSLYSVHMGISIIHKWDLARGRELGRFEGHDKIILGIAITPDGKHLISVARNDWRMWDANTFKEVFRSKAKPQFYATSISPDGKKLLTIGSHNVEIWDIENKSIARQSNRRGYVYSADIFSNGSFVLGDKWIQNKDTIKLCRADLRQNMIISAGSHVACVHFSSDGKYIVAGLADGSIHLCLYDLANPRRLHQFQAHNKTVLRARFADDGKRLFSCGVDGSLKIWEVPGDMVIAAKVEAKPTTQWWKIPPGNWKYLADMKEFDVKSGPWPFANDGSTGNPERRPIQVGGQRSPKGLGMHPPDTGISSAKYRLDGKMSRFRAGVALDDSAKRVTQFAKFEVLADGTSIWQSEPVRNAGHVQVCDVDVTGKDTLELRVRAPASHFGLHAVWLEPAVLLGNDPNKPQQLQRLPIPELVYLGKEVNQSTTKYWFSIANWSEYTDERFAAAGLVPPTKPVIEIRGTKNIHKSSFDRIEKLKKFSVIVPNNVPHPESVIAIVSVPKKRSYSISNRVSLSAPK